MLPLRDGSPPGLLALLFAFSLLLFTAGCSGLVPVEGEVLLDDKPLPKADIAFIPQAGGRTVTGKSDAQGKFLLTTIAPNDGAKPGEYKVTVTAREVKYEGKPGSEEGFVEKHTWLAPEHYSDPAKSGLTAKVSAAEPKVTLKLKSTP
jgi:hypothetical protein